MLKKLVRYGNSNALVLDKAILELLNIAEGSVVKISTDGKSIILTPQQEVVVQHVNETVTSTDALHRACIKGSIAYYKDFDLATQKTLEKEMSDIMSNHFELLTKVASIPAFQEESAALKIACGADVVKFAEMNKALMEKYIPELAKLSEKIADFDKKCRLLAGKEPVADMQQKQKDAEKDFREIFAKHKDTQMACGVMMQSPEYQHRAQLLTEKYQDNQGSVEFVDAMKQLMYEFCPEMKQLHKDLEVVREKYKEVNV